MQPWITRCKQQIGYICRYLLDNFPAEIQIVGYRDISERKCQDHKLCPVGCHQSDWISFSPLTNDPNVLNDYLKPITASGGGDIAEDIFGALQEIDTFDTIVLIADASAHGYKDHNDHYMDAKTLPLPYDGSRLPREILAGITAKFVVLDIKKGELDSLALDMKATRVSLNNPWKFGPLVADTIAQPEDVPIALNDYKAPFTNFFLQLQTDSALELIEKCFMERQKDALRAILMVRDREGQYKEKKIALDCLNHLKSLDKVSCFSIYPRLIEVGCFRDLLVLASKGDNYELEFMASLIYTHFVKNLDKRDTYLKILSKKKKYRFIRMEKSLRTLKIIDSDIPTCLVAKWIPREGHSWDKKYKFFEKIANLLFSSTKLESLVAGFVPCYEEVMKSLPPTNNPEAKIFLKEMISFLRDVSDIPVEVRMCDRKWQSIDLTKVTAGALTKYKKAWVKRIPYEVKRVVKEKKAKAIDAHKLINHFIKRSFQELLEEPLDLEDSLVNEQWAAIKKEPLEATFQIDRSGSMLDGNALTSALKLFLLSGQSSFISFQNPRWINVEGKTLGQKIDSILKDSNEITGDIPGGLKLALQQKPKAHFVLTDGKVPLFGLEEAIKIRDEMSPETKVVILKIGSETLLRTPKDLVKNFYIVSGSSPAIIHLLMREGDIEENIIQELRDKYKL
jgi:hypothetical protein